MIIYKYFYPYAQMKPSLYVQLQQAARTHLDHLRMAQSRQKCHSCPVDPQRAGTTPHLWFEYVSP
jgi:hypothetical protein